MLLENMDMVQAKDFTTSERLVLVLTGEGQGRTGKQSNLHLFIQSSGSFWIMFLPHLTIQKKKKKEECIQQYTLSSFISKANKPNIPITAVN